MEVVQVLTIIPSVGISVAKVQAHECPEEGDGQELREGGLQDSLTADLVALHFTKANALGLESFGHG